LGKEALEPMRVKIEGREVKRRRDSQGWLSMTRNLKKVLPNAYRNTCKDNFAKSKAIA